MEDIIYYPLSPEVEAFTTRRKSALPYPVIQGHQVHGSRVAIIDRPDMTREDILAAIGPSIGPDSFQVGEEVALKFKESGFPMSRIWSFQGPGNGSPMSGGHHIDLWQANIWILQECGLREEHIQLAPIDTFRDPTFFSARREGIACGRNINAIRLK